MINKENSDPRYRFFNENDPAYADTSLEEIKEMLRNPDAGEESYVGENKLAGKRALITGGDSGIGRAVAIAFAREGADVAIQYLEGEESDAQEVASYIEEAGQRSLLLEANFKEYGSGAEVVEKAVEEFGGLDILVLNAAQQFAQDSLEDLSMDQVRDTFEVKLFTIYEAVKAAEPHLNPGASIIVTTSEQGFNPSTQFMDYAATNAAVSNLTVNLAPYFGPQGVRINGVAPGAVWSPLQLDGGQSSDEGILSFGKGGPLGRAGQPVELAPVYVLLASDDASYITGSIYSITGGSAIDL